MRRVIGMAPIGLLAAGCAAHGAVPLNESSSYAPETIRQVLTDKVLVRDRPNGHLVARYFRPNGSSDYCGADDDGAARSYKTIRWVVGEDLRGRATFHLTKKGSFRYLYVPHYDPESGELRLRRAPRTGERGWVTGMRGWLQDSWPAVMAERCPGLAAGVRVDERQTAMTLRELRRQTPDAPLKHLAQPLPGPQTRNCEFRQKKLVRGTPCADGKGEIVTWQVFAGRCADWGTVERWGGGKLVREESDASACGAGGGPRLRPGIIRAADAPGTVRTGTASSRPAAPTSGTAKCVKTHEGTATWTLGADGKRVWDTSGCRPRQ